LVETKVGISQSSDNPGRPGKDWARLVGPVPLETQSKDRIRRQDSPVPLTAFARGQRRENGTQATRSDEKPLPVESSSAGRFRPMRESQWPKGPTVITAHQHGANDSGGSRQRGSAKRKTPKGGTKGAFETGRTQRLGRTCENLPQRRRCRKRHRWPVSET
jgi:hypothetical protein